MSELRISGLRESGRDQQPAGQSWISTGLPYAALRIHSTYDICITQAAPTNTQEILHKNICITQAMRADEHAGNTAQEKATALIRLLQMSAIGDTRSAPGLTGQARNGRLWRSEKREPCGNSGWFRETAGRA